MTEARGPGELLLRSPVSRHSSFSIQIVFFLKKIPGKPISLLAGGRNVSRGKSRLADRAPEPDFFCYYRGGEALNMLLITDFGCELHLLHRLRYSGPEAQIMREIIANLPTESEGHTYVCEHGHSHRLKLEVQIPESLVTGVYEFDRH